MPCFLPTRGRVGAFPADMDLPGDMDAIEMVASHTLARIAAWGADQDAGPGGGVREPRTPKPAGGMGATTA
jgi:hypothetical protein